MTTEAYQHSDDLGDHLSLSEDCQLTVDHREGDLRAFAIIRTNNERRVVYVCVLHSEPGRYYYECEEPCGPEPSDARITSRGDTVDISELSTVVESHLG